MMLASGSSASFLTCACVVCVEDVLCTGDDVVTNNLLHEQLAEVLEEQASRGRAVRRASMIDVNADLEGAGDEDDEAKGEEEASGDIKKSRSFFRRSKSKKQSKKKGKDEQEARSGKAPKRIPRPGVAACRVLAEKSLVQARMRHKFCLAAIKKRHYNIDRGLFYGALCFTMPAPQHAVLVRVVWSFC